MVMAVDPPTTHRGKRFGRRFLPRADINVTPFVDVILVLLIVFMVTAPLLTIGELVNLPQTNSENLPSDDDEPLAIIIQADGQVRIQETLVPIEELRPRLQAIAAAAGMAPDERIYLYLDGDATANDFLPAMTEIRGAGFGNLALPTDPLPAARAETAAEAGTQAGAPSDEEG